LIPACVNGPSNYLVEGQVRNLRCGSQVVSSYRNESIHADLNMFTIHLPTDAEAEAQGFRGPEAQRRREVLRETISAFERCEPGDYFHRFAQANLLRWAEEAAHRRPTAAVPLVLQGDWGEVTQMLTKTYGTCFAVLNMANAYFPGGAYGQGAVAQEENMFRRTDCHFRIRREQLGNDERIYSAEMHRLVSAQDGRLYLDLENPRVCIRGAEDRSVPDLGYRWLAENEVFPYFELRAAALDLRGGEPFDGTEARICAQVNTLRANGVRHVVFGAFGCGAFQNPAGLVAKIYRKEIERCSSDFSVVAFAIFSAGYGPGNYMPFKAVFENNS
jgi:hypothetical protein